jgi:hypothetical protein
VARHVQGVPCTPDAVWLEQERDHHFDQVRRQSGLAHDRMNQEPPLRVLPEDRNDG